MTNTLKIILTVTRNHLVTDKAQIAKELMIMRFAIGQSFFLVVTMTQERFLAFGTDKMLEIKKKNT